jgi:hypothetical protein
MSAKQQAAYVKAHPKSKQAQDAKDKEEPKKDVKGREYDPKTGKGKGTDYRGGQGSDEEWFASMMGGGEPEDKPPEGMASDAEKRMTQIDKERESLSRQYNRLDQPGADKSGEGKAKVMKKWDALDAEYDELEKSVGDEPESDPGSKWNKHSTKVKATSPEHQKEIDAWMKKYSNPKGGVDWDQAKKDNAPFPKGEPKELEKGAKVTAKWTGVTGDEQSIPDGEIEDTKYNEDGTVDSYNIRWNNGNNLINLSADKVKGEEPKEKRPGGEQAEEDYQKADQMMMKYAGVDIEKAEYWAKKKREASDKMMGRTGKELGEDKMDESVKMHAISGNKRFMTKTAIPILKKYGVKNVRANTVGGYFLELRFQIDSKKLKDLDKELKRKNKTAYGGIVETRRDKMKEDVLRKVIREEIKKMIKEDEEAFSQPIPATIDRYMKKFIDAVARGNLNRKRKLAILGRTIVALQLDPQEVSKYARLVKREL